jgi:ABC-2 type transport system permease protein
MAAMIGVLIVVAKNPEMAAKLGLMGTKSSVMENVDWPSYMGLLGEMISALGLIGYGFVISWMFGREYSDRTVKDLLALPFPRSYIVISKLVVAAVWCIVLSVILLAASLLVGWLTGLQGGSNELILNGSVTYGITALLALLLSTPIAFLASYGRGYLPPIGFIIITMLLGQFALALGLAAYFPWAVPGLYSMTGAGGEPLGMASYVILALTSIIGVILAYAWWRYADQH